MPADTVSDAVPAVCRERIFLTLPRFCADEAKVRLWLEQAKALGFSHVVCENVSHIRLLPVTGADASRRHGTECGKSVLSVFFAAGILAGRDPLTGTDHCPEPALHRTARRSVCLRVPAGHDHAELSRTGRSGGCRNCTHGLTDRTGRTFPVYCHKAAGITTMYNAVPTWMADKQEQLSHSSFLGAGLYPAARCLFRAPCLPERRTHKKKQ